MNGEVVGDGYWNLLADGARCSWSLFSSSPYRSVGVGVSGRSFEHSKLETEAPREGEREKDETNDEDGERESIDPIEATEGERGGIGIGEKRGS